MYTLKSKYLVLKLVVHTQMFARTFYALRKVKLQGSFAKEPYQRDYIVQKRPVIVSILRYT